MKKNRVSVGLAVAAGIVAFGSYPTYGLVPGTNYLVSSDASGVYATGSSFYSDISETGRYVAFTSNANNLVVTDTDDDLDVYVKDRQTGVVERVSIDMPLGFTISDVTPSVSPSGNLVAFVAATMGGEGVSHVYVRDRLAGQTKLVSQVNGVPGDSGSTSPKISDNERYIVYASSASNLVGSDADFNSDIFMYDLLSDTTRQLTELPNGSDPNGWSAEPAVSADGRYVSFTTTAKDLAPNVLSHAEHDIVLLDTTTSEYTYITNMAVNGDGGWNGSISADGQRVAFMYAPNDIVPGQSDTSSQVFYYDRSSGEILPVSRNTTGQFANGPAYGSPSISSDGRYIAYASAGSNLVAVVAGINAYLYDTQLQQTELLSKSASTPGNNNTSDVSLSGDASSVSMTTSATNLAPRYRPNLYDIVAGITGTVSVPSTTVGVPQNVRAVSPTSNAPLLNWDPVAGATSYKVWRKDELSGAELLVASNVIANTYTDEYRPGFYSYKVAAVNGAQVSDWSEPVRIVVTSGGNTGYVWSRNNVSVVPDANDILPRPQNRNTAVHVDFGLGYLRKFLLSPIPLTMTYSGRDANITVRATSVNWLVITGANKSDAYFEGTARATTSGRGRPTVKTVPYSVKVTDSRKLGQRKADSVVITIYSDNAKSSILYKVDGSINKGDIVVQ